MIQDHVAARAPPELTPIRSEHSGAFVRLSRLWQQRHHFSLVFAAVDNPAYRDALIARLETLAPAQRVDLAARDSAQTWLSAARDSANRGAQRLHVCLPIDARCGSDWWQQANLLRERLADAMPGVQVLWMADAEVDTAAHHAPDLWNWRDAVFVFTAVAPLSAPVVAGARFEVAGAVDVTAVNERLRAIETFLARSDTDDVESAHLYLEAAKAYRRLGQLDQCATAASRAAALFGANGDESHAAQANSVLAEVRWRQGQPDQALRDLIEQVLPVFERLGDIRQKAITLGRIADILRARGQLDEALRIRREDVLPVYERLGDERSMLVERTNLALNLAVRGGKADAPEIERLLKSALVAAKRLNLPEAMQIEDIYRQVFGRALQAPDGAV